MIYQYYIFIVKKDVNGEYSHEVKWAYDEDEIKAYDKGENIYYDELSKAAINDTVFTSVTLISANGEMKKCNCKYHVS